MKLDAQQPVSRKSEVSFIKKIRHRYLPWLLLGLPFALVLATALGRLGRSFFLFELLSHFAAQYAVLSGGLLIYWLFRRRWLPAVAALTGLVWNGLMVLPWLTADPPPGPSTADLRVLHTNVLYTRPDVGRIRQLIARENPDLFVLQELTQDMHLRLTDLRAEYPHQIFIWAKGPCYMLVGSRTPFTADSTPVRQARTIHLRTTVRGQALSFVTLHPRTPVFPAWFRQRNQRLTYAADLVRRQTEPTLWIGDFNVSPFSPVYDDLIKRSGTQACREGFGLAATWIRWCPPLMIPIDHALINDGFRTVNFRTAYMPESDHKALIVDLAFRKTE